MHITKLGGLTARLTGGTDGRGGGDGPLVVMLHGFGAPGDDLVPLHQVIQGPPGTRYVFPEASLTLGMGFGESRAWWMIDMDQLQRDIASGRVRDLSQTVPQGLAEARAAVTALLHDIERTMDVKPTWLVLGGFSQGAMLACDVVLRTARSFAGLILLSGTLLTQDEWGPLMPARQGLPVLQSHGRSDPLLSVVMAERLRDRLTAAGLPVHWVPFNGGHEIPMSVVRELGPFVTRITAS